MVSSKLHNMSRATLPSSSSTTKIVVEWIYGDEMALTITAEFGSRVSTRKSFKCNYRIGKHKAKAAGEDFLLFDNYHPSNPHRKVGKPLG